MGSGKTTVWRLFETLRVPVYYADDHAKEIIQTDAALVKALKLSDEILFVEAAPVFTKNLPSACFLIVFTSAASGLNNSFACRRHNTPAHEVFQTTGTPLFLPLPVVPVTPTLIIVYQIYSTAEGEKCMSFAYRHLNYFERTVAGFQFFFPDRHNFKMKKAWIFCNWNGEDGNPAVGGWICFNLYGICLKRRYRYLKLFCNTEKHASCTKRQYSKGECFHLQGHTMDSTADVVIYFFSATRFGFPVRIFFNNVRAPVIVILWGESATGGSIS